MLTIETEVSVERVLHVLDSLATFPYEWSHAAMAAATRLRLSDDGRLAGFFWFHQIGDGDTAELHVAVAPEWEGRWLTRATLAQLLGIARQRGIATVVVQAHEPLIADLMTRLGARMVGPFAILNLKEIRHGRHPRRPQDQERPHATSDAPARGEGRGVGGPA